MTTYYRYNALTRVLTAEPRYIVLADRTTITNPTAEQYASLRDAYPKGEDAPLPEPQEGKVSVYGGYELGETDNLWHKQWVLVDAPPPPPRTFSKLRIVAAQDFREDNEYFVQGKTALQTALGWTDEQVEAVLAAAEGGV